MVFRGKPSKACERCRNKRLRCDLQRPDCSSCIRAEVTCTGYRDTPTVRFNDESEHIRKKALAKNKFEAAKPKSSAIEMVPKFKIRHLCQDLPILSRDVFFRYYVSDFSHTWNFLYKYLDSPNAPAHLTLGIDAVSLAFLAYQVESQTARDLGRRKYGEALRSITASLQDPDTARAKTTFEGAVLLDLCEKIAKSATEVGHDKHAHVEGALALVKLRGVKTFQPGPEMQALVGLSLNSTVCSLSAGQPADPIVHEIRQHAAHFISPDDPKWQLSGLILETTDLVAEMRCGILTPEERVEKSLSIDRDLEALALTASPKWPCHHKHFTDSDTRKVLLPDGFLRLYTVYPTRIITQMSNVLRLTRILLCEEIIASCAALSPTTAIQSGTTTATAAAHATTAKATLSCAVREVCASVPQMTDCEGAARPKLPPPHTTSSDSRDKGIGKHHTHTTSHILDVYVLVFSLYVVASTPHAEVAVKEWSVQQLEHVSAHFGLREAGVMVGILRRQKAEILDVEKEKLAMDGGKVSGKEGGIKEGDVRGGNGEGHSEVKGDSWWPRDINHPSTTPAPPPETSEKQYLSSHQASDMKHGTPQHQPSHERKQKNKNKTALTLGLPLDWCIGSD